VKKVKVKVKVKKVKEMLAAQESFRSWRLTDSFLGEFSQTVMISGLSRGALQRSMWSTCR